MAIYEIYASGDPEQTRFVKDKGALLALFLPAIWLAWNRLWYGLIIYLCIAFFFFAITNTQWAMLAAVFSFVPGLYLFLEGPSLIAAKFQKSGLHLTDVIDADSLESAELKWLSKQREAVACKGTNRQAPSVRSSTYPASGTTADKPEFGLFSEE